MNIFITGGAGFIGSHLAQRFLALKCNVAVIDDLSTGSMRNIAHLKSSPGFSYPTSALFSMSRSSVNL